jgi:hypothetical protein
VSPITRSWIAFAAVGAGLIYLALVVSASVVVGGILAVIGIAGFAWGVLVMFDDRFLAPRVAVIAVLVPIGVWLGVVLLASAGYAELAQGFRPFPLIVATVLELFVAVALALHLRRGSRGAAPTTRRYVIGLLAGILVIGALVAPALAATEGLAPRAEFEDGIHH